MTCRFTSPGNHSQSASMFLHFGFLARFRCIVAGYARYSGGIERSSVA
jgi:hypothetical protein